MNSNWPSSTKQTDCGGDNGGSGGCDLKEFDDLSCTVVGNAAQAEYMKKYQPKLTERRARFETARTQYQQMRTTVAPTIKAIADIVGDPDKSLCQVPSDERDCLREAWYVVKAKLEDCGTSGGCCVPEPDTAFSSSLDETPTVPEVQAAIAAFDAQVTRVEKCFDTLISEPANLKKRVDELDSFVKAAQKNTDHAQAYAQMLWAKYRLDTIYWGFENSAAFEDCLCTALNASLAGRQALAALTGLAAELACQEEGKNERCTSLRAHVVDEIMSICRRRQPQTSTASAG
jgi:hypothetical protein